MQQHDSKYFARRSLPPYYPTPLQKVKNFLEHGHVTYQIKKNHEYSNMVENILPADTYLSPLTLWMGPIGKIQLFRNLDMLHIKLKRITNAAQWNHIFCLQTPPPTPRDTWSSGQNSSFSEYGHVA